ncbi:MAG: manganese efflux pump [Paludibacteraceae bacterium]|nr:manganese efflux pump [Paludibacteraceae bacterium]
MDWINVIVMGIGLAMDCCAVSTVQGLTHKQWHPRALLMALIFGCFHMGMPIIGYYAGTLFVNTMRTYAPWIALALLGFLGVKMIWESRQSTKDDERCTNWSIMHLLFLAVATSIDVLATGLLFVPYPEWLYPSVVTIGGITALFSLGGYLLGVYVGKLKLNMELIGGLVLIGLGIKIWAEGFLCS